MNQIFGLLNVPRLLKQVANATNAGVVSIAAAATDIAVVALGSLSVGDVILVFASVRLTKGITAGSVLLETIQIAGGGTIAPLSGANIAGYQRTSVPANDVVTVTVCSAFTCTFAGSVSFSFRGNSGGSNSSVAVHDGGMSCLVMAA